MNNQTKNGKEKQANNTTPAFVSKVRTITRMQFKKNELVSVYITDLGKGGVGIGRVNGYTLFVKDALIGDLVMARITKPKKTYAYARVEYIQRPSPDRIQSPCPVARKCGGCQIQGLEYSRQLAYKQAKVREDLIRIGGFLPEQIDAVMGKIVGMEDLPDGPWRYRNKAQVPVGRSSDGRIVAGFYAERTHVIIPMTDCLLGQECNQEILDRILTYMELRKVPPYDEKTGKGLIRHVLIRSGKTSGQIMVCLVVNGERLPYEKELTESLAEIPGMTSVTLNINTEQTNVILGKELRTLWGEDEIEDTLHVLKTVEKESAIGGGFHYEFEPAGESVTFRISPLSFYQVNPKQTEKLYSLALEFAGLTGTETVWDLYCGVGTISLFLARHAGSVFGVEVIPEAIENAKANAVRNGITNAVFYVGKAEEILPEFVTWRRANDEDPEIDVICVDPPRKGCDPKCLETILEIRPQRVVYVSCDPATLARDLRILADGGYKLERVVPVDQFGNTIHVETVCLLTHT